MGQVLTGTLSPQGYPRGPSWAPCFFVIFINDLPLREKDGHTLKKNYARTNTFKFSCFKYYR